ncbi:MAG: LapA family protein [Gloeocapsa sp. DLM2.Bin57]|nr:MAG: LapA family protein [Gloeocapsa sp. DLM2.Bin57]
MMKNLANLIAATLIMGWIVSVAVFSIQNIQPVSISFLVWESITMPIGVLLAFCVGFGLILGAILPLAWGLLVTSKKKKPLQY